MFVASNSFDSRKTERIIRKERYGSKQRVICPQMISKYNRFMDGVDAFDQCIFCYSVDRKSKRNWFRIFVYFLRASLSNAFVCYNDLKEKYMNFIDFLSSIAMLLIDDQSSRKRRGRSIRFPTQKRWQIQGTPENKSLSILL